MWLMLALLALPLIEIALFVVIGGAIGLWWTLAWVVLSVVLGVLILKRVARLGPISFDRDVRSLRDPMSPIAGRALTILGAGLLILPGFFTDALGLLLLLPPVQGLLVSVFSQRLRQSDAVRHGSVTIEGDWTEVTPAGESQTTDANAGAAEPPSAWTRH
jgi:UPF0716 protein FxsA